MFIDPMLARRISFLKGAEWGCELYLLLGHLHVFASGASFFFFILPAGQSNIIAGYYLLMQANLGQGFLVKFEYAAYC
jgi:hypothetical protein